MHDKKKSKLPLCLSTFPPTSILQGQPSLQQRHGLRCRSRRWFWTFLSKNVPFAAASGVLDLPSFSTRKSASTKWVLWLRTCVHGSLPTGQLLPGVGACVSSGIHYGDVRLLTQHPVSHPFLTCSWILPCLGEIPGLKNSTVKLFTLRLKWC